MSRNILKSNWVKPLIFIIFIYTLDCGIGNVLRYYYFKQEVGRLSRTNYAYNETKEDVLVFGSSRAYHHYIPTIIQEKTNFTCYNVGAPGQFILFNIATLKAVLSRYNPKVIILDIMPGEFLIENSPYDRLSFLLPYYKDHPEIHSIVELRGPFERFKLMSKIYPFNSSFLMIAGGNSSYFKQKNKDQHGFVPLKNVLNKAIQQSANSDYMLDSIKVDMLKQFIQLCKEKNIKLIVGCSPSFKIFINSELTIKTAHEICESNNIQFFDYSNNQIFTSDCRIYDDPSHLNEKGAILFTQNFADKFLLK